MRDLLQRSVLMVPRSLGQKSAVTFRNLKDIVVAQLVQDKYGKPGAMTASDCRDLLQEHRARVEGVMGAGLEDRVLLQNLGCAVFLICVVGCVSCFCALESEDDCAGSAFDLHPCLVCVQYAVCLSL